MVLIDYVATPPPPTHCGAKLSKNYEQGAFVSEKSIWVLLGYRVAELGRLFVGSKIGNENFCQVRIYNFSVKCVVFVGNRKFAKLTQ